MSIGDNKNKNIQSSNQNQNLDTIPSSNVASNINNYGDIALDLNADNYPKKFKKFVGELTILLDNMTLANVSIYIYTYIYL